MSKGADLGSKRDWQMMSAAKVSALAEATSLASADRLTGKRCEAISSAALIPVPLAVAAVLHLRVASRRAPEREGHIRRMKADVLYGPRVRRVGLGRQSRDEPGF